MKVYKVSRRVLIFYSAVFVATVGAGGFALVVTRVKGASSQSAPLWFMAAWFGLVLWSGWSCLRMPLDVRLGEGSYLEFRSLLGRIVVAPADIESISGPSLGGQYVEFKHVRGKIRMFLPIEGLYDLISTLKSLNPAINVKRL